MTGGTDKIITQFGKMAGLAQERSQLLQNGLTQATESQVRAMERASDRNATAMERASDRKANALLEAADRAAAASLQAAQLASRASELEVMRKYVEQNPDDQEAKQKFRQFMFNIK